MKPFRQPLQAESLYADPRVQEAKELLLAAVREHQRVIQEVRPPQEERKKSYQEILEEFAQCRGAPLFYPYLGSGIGNGALVELLDGSIKYDLITGIGVHYWGHSDPKLIAAGVDAAISDTVMQGHLQQNQESVELSQLLIRASGLDHCFLTSSGVMANENALKMAFQKRSPAYRLLAFSRNFSGRTLYFTHVTDKPLFREGLPPQGSVDYVPYYDAKNPKESLRHSLAVLQEHLNRYPGQHAAMIFELVQGEGGVYPGTHEFFAALMQELKERDICILIDEIQTFGRTPSLFAFQHFGLEEYADIVTIGKLSHTCATIFRSSYKPKSGLLSQTFISSSFALRASKVIIETLLEEGYFGQEGKVVQIHNQMAAELQRISEELPGTISGPYGIGCMVAFTPFSGKKEEAMAVAKALFEEGVISFLAGENPNRIRFLLPAGALTEQDIRQVGKILRHVLRKGPS